MCLSRPQNQRSSLNTSFAVGSITDQSGSKSFNGKATTTASSRSKVFTASNPAAFLLAYISMENFTDAVRNLFTTWAVVPLTKTLAPAIFAEFAGTVTDATQTHSSTPPARSNTKGLRDWLWHSLTLTLFIMGYFVKTALSVESWMFYLSWYVLLEDVSRSMSLILHTVWVVYTSHRAREICEADFRAFIGLGAGGTPSTWNGFKRITLLAWFGRINVLQPPRHDLGKGFLEQLHQRDGRRPIVGGIAPQRQLDQRSPKPVFDYFLAWLDHFSAEHIAHIRKDYSFLEKNTMAILAHCDCVSMPILRTFGCEIAHPHDIDESLHVVLHPDDIREVIEKGWGERHPLARANSWWCWWFSTFEGRPPVPEHLCLIYAPRNHFEVCVLMEVVDAGARFVAGDSRVNEDEHLSCPNHYPRTYKSSTEREQDE